MQLFLAFQPHWDSDFSARGVLVELQRSDRSGRSFNMCTRNLVIS